MKSFQRAWQHVDGIELTVYHAKPSLEFFREDLRCHAQISTADVYD